MSETRIALIRDWLTVYAGADRVMDAMLELLPGAPIYTLIYQPEHFTGTRVARHPIFTSFIDRLPGGRRHHRLFLPLMPLAIEQFDLRGYDVVVSMSHAVAKGVLTRADQLHIAYILTPVRYGWDLYHQYLDELNLQRGVRSMAARLTLHYLRLWDRSAASRPDVMVAVSRAVARRVRKTYRRDADVLYPPVDVHRFTASSERNGFFLTVSRFVPYKRVDLIVEAFSRLGLPLVVIGDGPDRRRVQKAAGPTVQLLGAQPDEVVRDHMERCRAFVFAAEEDFGVAVVEAQAAGAPVIAYDRGGVAETVLAGETGVFFSEQTPESLMNAVNVFEATAHRFSATRIRAHAERFGRERFQREFAALLQRERARFDERGRDVLPIRPAALTGT